MRNVLMISAFTLTTGCISLGELLDILDGTGGDPNVVDPVDEPGDPADPTDPTDPTDPGEPTDPVDGTVDPASLLEVILDCNVDAGYEVDTWIGEAGDPALWLASVYETHSNHGGGNHPMGEATVFFDLAGDNVLALASYEPVTWNITLGEHAGLSKVVVFGYHEQVVEGVDVPVEFHGAPYCGYSLPYNGGGCDTDALIDAVEDVTGLGLSRFDGCYTASDFQFVSDEVEPEPEPEPVVPCGPGETVELTYAINAETMRIGASDETGAGACTGLVTFFDDLEQGYTARTWDHATGSFIDSPVNAQPVDCDSVHCNDVVYGDGRVDAEYCSLYAVCEDGVARATGFTW